MTQTTHFTKRIFSGVQPTGNLQLGNYLGALKKETAFKVAVKPIDSTEWLEVGAVKSQGSDKTEWAVARQRALIAEVRVCCVVVAVSLLLVGTGL